MGEEELAVMKERRESDGVGEKGGEGWHPLFELDLCRLPG